MKMEREKAKNLERNGEYAKWGRIMTGTGEDDKGSRFAQLTKDLIGSTRDTLGNRYPD
jgi:hypothetical protein